MLKQFIALKNLLSSSGFFSCFLFFQLALACRFSVSLGSPCHVSIAAYSSQSVPAKIKEDEPGDRVEECRKQCRVDFQLETLKT